LLYHYSECDLAFVRLGDGVRREIQSPGRSHFLRWDDAGVWIAVESPGSPSGVYLWNATTGISSDVLQVSGDFYIYRSGGFSVSPALSSDHRTLSIWSVACLGSDAGACGHWRAWLHYFDNESGRSGTLATVVWGYYPEQHGGMRATAFSPGGKKIASVIGNDIYVSDVPR